MLRCSGLSASGPVRITNEDCFLADVELSLFVVADGMGGHAAGEVASRLAVDAIENFIRRSHSSSEFSWPCGIEPALSLDGNRLRTAIYLANRRVFRAAESNDDYLGMGSTVVCALIRDGRLTIGHVGDSRLYLLADGILAAQTRDDTWAAAALASGGGPVDHHALAQHPMRHVLTNVLGARDHAEIHIAERQLRGGETLLLCTDGVHNVIDDLTLTAILGNGLPVEEAARTVVQAALEAGSRDNLTALVIRYDQEDAHAPA